MVDLREGYQLRMTVTGWTNEKRRKYQRTPEQRRRYMRVYMRERYQLLASIGLCVDCGKAESRPNKRTCEGCA